MSNRFRPAVRSALNAIGDTPVVQLQRVVPSGSASVFVKLEYFNSTGSYKDRMALSMIEEAERRGDLRPGMTVVEYTGGSTGSSLAFVCAVKGYRLKIVSSDAFAEEKIRTMRALGAEVEIIPSAGGKTTPDLIPRMKDRAATIARAEGAYFTNQIYNPDIIKGYEQMGQEIVEQITGPVDAFCAGVGTAGMIMGVARCAPGLSCSTHLRARARRRRAASRPAKPAPTASKASPWD